MKNLTRFYYVLKHSNTANVLFGKAHLYFFFEQKFQKIIAPQSLH